MSSAHEPMGSVAIRGGDSGVAVRDHHTDNRGYAAPKTDRNLKVSLAAAYDRNRDVAVSQKGGPSGCGKTFLTDSYCLVAVYQSQVKLTYDGPSGSWLPRSDCSGFGLCSLRALQKISDLEHTSRVRYIQGASTALAKRRQTKIR